MVVTGCGSGIGAATLLRLSREGHYVVGLELDPAGAAAAQQAVGNAGTVLRGDVRDRELLQQAAAEARRTAPLWGWVNNAGIEARGTLHGMTPDVLQHQLEVDLLAFVWGTQIAVQAFLDQGTPGSIVNISSLHGRLGYPGWAGYDVAKGGVDSLTRYAAVEYGPAGVRVNAIAPGSVRTAMHVRYVSAAPDPARLEAEMAAVVPIRRIAEPDEIAAVAAFLLSDSASYLTGQCIAVDGGFSIAGGVFETHPDVAAALNRR